MFDPVYPAPPLKPAPARRPTLLFFVLIVLCGLLAAPYLVERIQYASTRGKMRARADHANEELKDLTETAGLVTLSDTSRIFKLVAQKIEPCVVHIDIKQRATRRLIDDEVLLLPQDGQSVLGQGSGFIVDEAGYILTNRHVIEDASEIVVHLSDGRAIENVELIGEDELTDLAVLKISASHLTATQWGDSNELEVGDWVLAVGSPFGLDRTVTSGIVSAKQRRHISNNSSYQDFMQTDAAVNPGNSGGPLLNMRGEVIGVNTAIVGKSYQGISFAIPSEVARKSYEQIIKHGRVPRGWLGVEFSPMTAAIAAKLNLPKEHGALVREVLSGTPAEKGGVQPRDVILGWNDREVIDTTDLKSAVASTEIGTTAKLTVWRDGERITLEI
ncbi:MAG TPA: trypsin-like peptidase domain-containing protein, partial [Pirellulales bacterium]